MFAWIYGAVLLFVLGFSPEIFAFFQSIAGGFGGQPQP